MKSRPWGWMLALIVAAWAGPGAGARINVPAAGGRINLPYIANDSNGNRWLIYQNGWLQQQGNMPVYSQGAVITVNGAQPQQNANQARIDEKTGEVVFDSLNANNGLLVTRRILIDKNAGFVRYIDIIRNSTAQDQGVNIQLQTNLNYGVNSAQMIADPKKKDHNLAWVAQTGANVAAVEIFAGKNSRTVPAINWPQGNNFVQGTLTTTVPAGKEVAFMHLHATAPNADAGAQLVNTLKEGPILKSIPTALRRLIVNFTSGESFIGDVEILRGGLLDVVELRGGDQLKGTLKENSFDLDTFYGPVTLPVDRVVALMSVGQFRPRQLVVTVDGEIFGGRLKKSTLDIQLSSGQLVQVPLGQVTRAGYRKRAGEPDEWTFTKAMVLMRSGDRINIGMPDADIEVVTRYGRLSLKPNVIAAVLLENEDVGVHQVRLTDGSRFAGLLSADMFDMKLDAPGNQSVRFPVGGMSRLQLAAKVAEQDDFTPVLKLANEDLLVGTLAGKLKLDTAFDTITVNATEVRSMKRSAHSATDVQIGLWDGTTLSGQLEDQELPVALSCGVAMKVPLPLLEEYSQPQPQPSAPMVDRIREVIADLNADDWKQRDRAQAQLMGMGPVAATVLKKLRENQPAEAQQRIDAVLRELDKQRTQDNPTRPAAAPAPDGDQILLPTDN